jgi:hypothetical protein
MTNEQLNVSSLPEICQIGDGTDFPSGIPTLCVTVTGDIRERYNVDNTVSISEYRFLLSENSNTVRDGIRTIALKASHASSGNNSQDLRIACDNEGETQVEVYLLNEAGIKPTKPVVIVGG